MSNTSRSPLNPSESRVRLNKLMAEAGIASRRKCDELIAEGAVTVNGKKVFELGLRVSPGTDSIKVHGKPLKIQKEFVYLMFHKPKAVITTMEDPEGRPCVGDYLKRLPNRVFPVGRLDWDSEGLVLLTNDGDFAHKVLHPKFKIPKTYLVKLSHAPSPEKVQKLLRGVSIPQGRAQALMLEPLERKQGDHPWYKIVIDEGMNRQIRHMFAKIGIDVIKLQRVAIGHLKLGRLPRGEMVALAPSELALILRPLVDKRTGASKGPLAPVGSTAEKQLKRVQRSQRRDERPRPVSKKRKA